MTTLKSTVLLVLALVMRDTIYAADVVDVARPLALEAKVKPFYRHSLTQRQAGRPCRSPAALRHE